MYVPAKMKSQTGPNDFLSAVKKTTIGLIDEIEIPTSNAFENNCWWHLRLSGIFSSNCGPSCASVHIPDHTVLKSKK